VKLHSQNPAAIFNREQIDRAFASIAEDRSDQCLAEPARRRSAADLVLHPRPGASDVLDTTAKLRQHGLRRRTRRHAPTAAFPARRGIGPLTGPR
jgi:hypothetical protein